MGKKSAKKILTFSEPESVAYFTDTFFYKSDRLNYFENSPGSIAYFSIKLNGQFWPIIFDKLSGKKINFLESFF